ncbi:MAG: glycogen synthase [Verrucomicrobiales bacterium]|nr:glycogen synthase [Verrucomicrobiales bacterium]|tara:strand:- start:32095 stop:33522 length:1428 start_codon:yes stop_codon:yes gene_type:complete
MHILQAASEFYPYSKTGGLADMVAGLSCALANAGHKLTVITPLYRSTKDLLMKRSESPMQLDIKLGAESIRGRLIPYETGEGIRVYFVEQKDFFDRQGIYMENGEGYPDNPDRFIFLSKAACRLSGMLPDAPDVLHCHDWQTAMIPLLNGGRIPTCLTIHNLAYQGVCAPSKFALTNLPERYFTHKYAEYYQQFNPLKAGIISTDSLTTVSPGYAEEIVTRDFGEGLEGELSGRADGLTGILNGVDYSQWRTDENPHLKHGYCAKNLDGKERIKLDLLDFLDLEDASKSPLFCYIGRLADQKGLHLLYDVLRKWLPENDASFVLLGAGDIHLESAFRELSEELPGKVRALIQYSEPLAHRIKAASDFFLMPSKFEPCGLNQIYSLRYGTVPIVNAVGGLKDTVSPLTSQYIDGTGFVFHHHSSAEFVQCLDSAVRLFKTPNCLKNVRERGMEADWGWSEPIKNYVAIYEKLLKPT